jgi:chaperonin GroES
MLRLDNKITLNRATITSPNLTDEFSDEDLKKLGAECLAGYKRDEESRQPWLRRNEAGMDLALQVQKDKTFPWPGCSNVAFPLVTIGALQFHARAYPALLDGPDIVKMAVAGPEDEATVARCDRVASHMSWQLLYEDKCWEEQEDKAILNVSIVGCCFKKTYRRAVSQGNVSELVLAKNLVLDYWAKSVEECPRKTHIIPMFRNDIYEGVARGIYRDVLEEAWYQSAPPLRASRARTEQDNRQGINPPPPDETAPFTILEQHVDVDLDQDGYAEPYIITLEESTGTVLRIVTRFDSEDAIERKSPAGRIIRIQPREYFTKKSFIPSPDGGIYDIGFGVFLGPLNEAVNSLVNMLLDCGTLQTTGGGFLARGAKIRGGTYNFSPFEWKRVDSTGDDLRKSIFPLPVNTPSDVLFQLLSLLINYASRVSGTTDITVGENPGQNTPAQTTQTMVEMGQKIYTAIFKRLWRSSKAEFEKLYKLNQMYLMPGKRYPGGATLADYRDDEVYAVCPVADPHATSESMQIQRALALREAAKGTPGYNVDLVERKFLTALRVEDVKAVFPGTQGKPPPEDPKITLEKLKVQGKLQLQQNEMAMAQAELQSEQQLEAIRLMEERRVNNAKIIELMAKAEESSANAQSEQAYAQIGLINAQISAAQSDNDRISGRLDQLFRALQLSHTINFNKEKLELEKRKLNDSGE